MILIEAVFTSVRLMVGVILIGIVPGYILTYRLFPPRTIDGLERLYLSSVSSLAISSLVAFSLSRSDIGLSAASMIVSVLAVTWLIGLLSGVSVTAVLIRQPRETLRMCFTRHRILLPLTASACVLLLMAFSVMTSHLRNDQSVAITEFFIQPEFLSADGVHYVQDEDTLRIPVTVINHGDAASTYRIGWATTDDASTAHTATLVSQYKHVAHNRAQPSTIQVDAGDTWAGILQVPVAQLAQADYIRVNLYYGAETTASSQLKIWLQPHHNGDER